MHCIPLVLNRGQRNRYGSENGNCRVAERFRKPAGTSFLVLTVTFQSTITMP
jgi:hypothetical protein